MKIIIGGVALAIFVSVGLLVTDHLRDNAFHLAEAERDACYGNQGYFLSSGQAIPDEVRTRCTQSMVAYDAGDNRRYVFGGLAGFAVAIVFALFAWLLILRKKPDGA